MAQHLGQQIDLSPLPAPVGDDWASDVVAAWAPPDEDDEEEEWDDEAEGAMVAIDHDRLSDFGFSVVT